MQSLAVADKVSFRNCLVSMQSSATKADLPSTHDITAFIHNSFVSFLKKMKEETKVMRSVYYSVLLFTKSSI